MKVKKPVLYPHWGTYSYSQRGFRRRVMPRMLARGFTRKQLEHLEELYFVRHDLVHLDSNGTYRNQRKFRLYNLARSVGKDRKGHLFSLVERSGLFTCYYDEDGRLEGFRSPKAPQLLGVMPF